MKTFRMLAAALGIVITTGVTGPAMAQSPLADAARREAARREAARSATIPTYTNQDLEKLPARAAPIAPRLPAPSTTVTTVGAGGDTATAGAQAAPPGADAAAPAGARDEKFWRTRITTARDNLTRAEMFAEALQTRVNALTNDAVNRDDPAQRQMLIEQRQKALDEMSRVQQEIAGFRREIAGIEEEARRAGVPAGWLR